jgi:hypothetical protein
MVTKGFKADTVIKFANVATTSNVVLSGIQNLDGLTGASGDIVCVWQQTDSRENGLYVMLSGAWKRSPDFNTDQNMRGSLIQVLNGTIYGKRIFQCTNTGELIVGSFTIKIDMKDIADISTTGWASWSGTGNFWSLTGSTFTLLRGGEGWIKGRRVVWDPNENTDLVANNGYFIAIDAAGTLEATKITDIINSDREIFFNNFETYMTNNIILFSCWFDGVELIVSKNTHPFSYISEISANDHFRLGSVFLFNGAKISLLSAANRTIQSIGTDLIDDHGVKTNFPDFTATSLSLIGVWKNAGGVSATLS